MNRNTAKKYAAEIIAFGDGKTIQFRRKGTKERWCDVFGSDANMGFQEGYEYRVKSEPEEFFITVYGNARRAVTNGVHGYDCSIGSSYTSAIEARKGSRAGARVFKVTEEAA